MCFCETNIIKKYRVLNFFIINLSSSRQVYLLNNARYFLKLMRIVKTLQRSHRVCSRERDLTKLDDVHYHASQRYQLRNRVGDPREDE